MVGINKASYGPFASAATQASRDGQRGVAAGRSGYAATVLDLALIELFAVVVRLPTLSVSAFDAAAAPLEVWDVLDPRAPVKVGSGAAGSAPSQSRSAGLDVALACDLVYVADGLGGLQLERFTAAAPAAPTPLPASSRHRAFVPLISRGSSVTVP